MDALTAANLSPQMLGEILKLIQSGALSLPAATAPSTPSTPASATPPPRTLPFALGAAQAPGSPAPLAAASSSRSSPISLGATSAGTSAAAPAADPSVAMAQALSAVSDAIIQKFDAFLADRGQQLQPTKRGRGRPFGSTTANGATPPSKASRDEPFLLSILHY